MRVFLTGGTGLIGHGLVRALIGRGDRPIIVSRSADRARLDTSLKGAEVVQGDPTIAGGWQGAVDGCDAVVNLAGQNIFAQRWSPSVTDKIRNSRVRGTENVVAAIAQARNRPKVLVQASAIGYYGPCGEAELTEASPPGHDFMAQVCQAWEAAAQPSAALGVRLAVIRTGVVLARGAGALGVMTPIFNWGPGAPIGGRIVGRGHQWLSWIHLEDIVGIFMLGLDRAEASGPINGTAPEPLRNSAFAKALTKALHRRWIYLPWGPPDAILKLMLGEVANLVTTGQKVLPRKAGALAYRFQFPELAHALANLFPRQAAQRPSPKAVTLGEQKHG
jgi:uncharacterized protein (TIGR01777 family)